VRRFNGITLGFQLRPNGSNGSGQLRLLTQLRRHYLPIAGFVLRSELPVRCRLEC
jgi:hypothetical protein